MSSLGVEKINAFAIVMLDKALLDDLLWSIAQGVGEIMGFNDCVIYLRNDNTLIQMAAFGLKNKKDRQIFKRIEIPVGEGIVGTVAKTGVAEYIPNTQADSRYIFDQFCGKSELTVPVIYEGTTIAVIDSESNKVNGYSDFDKEILQVIANIASPRIASAQYQNSLKVAQLRLERSNEKIKASMFELAQNQQSLIQSEKMASIGLLAAGIVHEINTPLGFSLSNLSILKDYIDEIKKVTHTIINNDEIDIKNKAPLLDDEFNYILNDSNSLIKESIFGLKSAKDIVLDLRNFSRSKYERFISVDINKNLKTTLNILRNELKNKCKVILNLNVIPEIYGDSGKLNQVFMNLLINASQACDVNGQISITTVKYKSGIVITIKDNGIGIPQKDISNVFSPFFTSKPVGEGTGLGLFISYKIICDEHDGTIDVTSSSEGTSFKIYLPTTQIELACS
ncbi:ATP-binding protein [Pseudoalteromonas denitrificans]|uniref:histidine kinase n=1 Tax=Pseudoalteromonas denitrificans DSM 6059 TaxID=1123010 RepID=A0A1I1V702_9GAMM|nr:ATP-binding protein [Pseudoalteromonas denitrificans]SFD78786.1 His Kinase A (phospho-acceptor) domain-containing protein [Pseudoalteromonas denitrificans DSM 6059]